MKTKKTKQIIIPPEGGWKEQSYYLVEIAYNNNNPIHGAVFFTGFLNNGVPAGYNEILRTEDHDTIGSILYMRAIKFLFQEQLLESVPNRDKLIREIK